MDQETNIESVQLNLDSQEKKKSSLIERIKDLNLKTVLFLTFLYVLQGIPVGVSGAIPLILSSRKIAYSHQGIYSFTRWPFSLRILWAPVIDRFFIAKIGRRKTWILFCQLFSGLFMLSTANLIDTILNSPRSNKDNEIFILTTIFGVLVFLSATNDITLDAWSIDLLPEKNAGLQSLCNSVGMSIGLFIGGSGFLILEAVESSNRIRSFFNISHKSHGLISIKNLFFIMGTCLTITSLLILKMKSENKKIKQISDREKIFAKSSILDTYKLIWKILLIKPVRIWTILMITHRFAFSVESSFNIKLVEKGIARENLSLIGSILSPILFWLPILLIDLINRSKPLKLFRFFFVLKMASISSFGIFLLFLDHFKTKNLDFSLFIYIILGFWKLFDGFLSSATSISLGSFNAHISDRLISGLYMTFLSFWPNLGANISRTSILFLFDLITFKNCEANTSFNDKQNKTISENKRGFNQPKCDVIFEPTYLIIAALCIYAAVWLLISRRYFRSIQKLPKSDWEVKLAE